MEPVKYAEMFAALGSEQRLEIVRLLLRGGEEGLTVGEIQEKLKIPSSTLSHHLEKLRHEDLVIVRRDRQCLMHTVNLETVGKLISFLCARCYNPERLAPMFKRITGECGKKAERKSHEREKEQTA